MKFRKCLVLGGVVEFEVGNLFLEEFCEGEDEDMMKELDNEWWWWCIINNNNNKVVDYLYLCCFFEWVFMLIYEFINEYLLYS